MTGEDNRENLSGHGVGGGKRCERVEGGFREGHREVGCDMEFKNQVFWLKPD